MPSHKKHCEDSRDKYGYDFSEVHSWMDGTVASRGPEHRVDRHDIDKTPDKVYDIFKDKVPPEYEKYIKDAAKDHIELDYRKGEIPPSEEKKYEKKTVTLFGKTIDFTPREYPIHVQVIGFILVMSIMGAGIGLAYLGALAGISKEVFLIGAIIWIPLSIVFGIIIMRNYLFSPSDYPIKKKKEGCFIATAAYGTPYAKELSLLRDFRDNTLEKTDLGRGLVKLYYSISPPMAKWISKSEKLRNVSRKVIVEPLVKSLEEK